LDTSRLAKGEFLPTTTARKRYRQTEKEDKNANDALKNNTHIAYLLVAFGVHGVGIARRFARFWHGVLICFCFLREKRGGEFCFDETIENFTR